MLLLQLLLILLMFVHVATVAAGIDVCVAYSLLIQLYTTPSSCYYSINATSTDVSAHYVAILSIIGAVVPAHACSCSY